MTATAIVTPIRASRDIVVSAPLPAAAGERRGSGKLRLTRRGRVVFGTLAALLIAGVFAIGAAILAPSAVATAEQSTQEFPRVLVAPGDSLWSIAANLDPAADTRDVVSEIARLNQISASSLVAGDSIAVPLRFAGAAGTVS